MRMKTKFKMEINDTPKTKIKISPALRSYLESWICSQLKQSPCDSMCCGLVTCGEEDACIGGEGLAGQRAVVLVIY